MQVGGRTTGMSSSRQESVADARAKSEAQAAKLAHSGKTMALLCLDRNASRAIKWAQFERFLAQLSSVLHFFFILLFIPLIFLAWTGRPFNMPAAGLILQYMVLVLSIIKMFWPTLKKMYLRQAKKASKRENEDWIDRKPLNVTSAKAKATEIKANICFCLSPIG